MIRTLSPAHRASLRRIVENSGSSAYAKSSAFSSGFCVPRLFLAVLDDRRDHVFQDGTRYAEPFSAAVDPVLTIFEAKVTADLVNELAMGPSEASNVARCAGADWHAPDDWKRKVVEAIERSANVARVFLLVARADEGWITIPSYANKNGPPRFEPMSKYEKWLARPLAVLPASDLLSFVYKKCEQIRNDSDDSRSRKKP